MPVITRSKSKQFEEMKKYVLEKEIRDKLIQLNIMNILIFDTETTGLPKSKYIDTLNLDEWPHIVQFSFIKYDIIKNTIVEIHDYIIKIPKNIVIPEDSINIHGISNEISNKKGVLMSNVFDKFFNSLQNTDKLIGHNINFDINILKVELLRLINDTNVDQTSVKKYKEYLHFINNYNNVYCTMKETINHCKLEKLDKNGKKILKYPKLIELHTKLFDTSPKNLHNSLNDILITLRCYMQYKHGVDLLTHCNTFKNLVFKFKLL